MYNEIYIDARTLTNLQQKIVNYDDKYKNGYIYIYDDDGKILTYSEDRLSISKEPCIKVFPNFIWHFKDNFKDKIIEIDKDNIFVIPEFGDYLIINQRSGKYEGIMDKKYYGIYDRINKQYYYPANGLYDYNLKIEKYTGGMLDGYLYFSDKLITDVTSYNNKKILNNNINKIPIKNNDANEYIFGHVLEIYEIPFIQSPDRKVNNSPIFNSPAKKIRVGYDDSLLYGKNDDNIYGFDKTLPKNSIGYYNNYFTTNTYIAKEDNQTTFKLDKRINNKDTLVINVYINNELQPKDYYNISEDGKYITFINVKRSKVNLSISNKYLNLYGEFSILNNLIKLDQEIDETDLLVFINNELQNKYEIIDKTIIRFFEPIRMKKNDRITINIREQLEINQYNKYNPLKGV